MTAEVQGIGRDGQTVGGARPWLTLKMVMLAVVVGGGHGSGCHSDELQFKVN